MSQPLWTPAPERRAAAQLTALARTLSERHGLPPEVVEACDYPALHRWSTEHLEAFWEAAWADAGVEVARPHTAVLAERGMPVVRFEADRQWFPGARFNFARHMLRFRDDHPALIAEGERAPRRTVTYRELYQQVCRCAAGLQSLGVGEGDRVAAYLPNTVETVVAMLATTSLGAVWSSTSPDFGYRGVLDRFGQIDPKVLLIADGYAYNGKPYPTGERGLALAGEMRSVEHTVMVPFLEPDAATPAGALSWQGLLERGGDAGEPPFPALPFDHPVAILYSSGTTGAPKCIVHGAGGTLLKHHVELRHHTDLRREDRLFYFTTCGWMMWNWLVSGLAQGATLVLYDGSPAWPGPERLYRLAEETGITVFGTSPKFLATCRNAGLEPRHRYDLSRMRTMCSTGAPLDGSLFHWVYEHVKADLQLASIAGGTDIIGCFMLGNPWQAVHAGEIQGPALGTDIAAYNDAGRPVHDAKGELVCRQPIPSMPVGFWNDPEGQRYRRAYFEHFPGVWRHGDFIRLTDRHGVVVYGRSDATLNPGGVRIGTAEIYRVVEALPEVQDSLVVGQPWQGDVRVILFVVPAPGVTWSEDLAGRIRAAIRAEATPRHVPARVVPIREVPVTLNGKKVELAVQRTLAGEAVTNREALANPQALDQFEGLRLD